MNTSKAALWIFNRTAVDGTKSTLCQYLKEEELKMDSVYKIIPAG